MPSSFNCQVLGADFILGHSRSNALPHKDSAYSDSTFAADVLPSAWRTERLQMFFKSYGHTCIWPETQADHVNDFIATEGPESKLDNKRF